jgi:hypothetical protein
MTTIEFDVTTDEGVRQAIAKHDGTTRKFTRNGPGGGNPCFVVEFVNDDVARRFLVDLFDDDDLATYRVT